MEKLKDKQMDFELHKSLQAAADSLLEGENPIPAFHWEIEFPEVFARENGGFDAFVGNPPFLGVKRISSNFGNKFKDWLAVQHEQSIRYAMDFFDRSLEEASKFPALLDIVRAKVKPQRDKQNRKAYRERWWQYAERQARL